MIANLDEKALKVNCHLGLDVVGELASVEV